MEINRPEAYEHFKLCRESPEYRMNLMQIDMEAQLEPSLCRDIAPREVQVIYMEDYQWINRQWDEVKQLKAMVFHLQKKEIRANAKKKPTDFY